MANAASAMTPAGVPGRTSGSTRSGSRQRGANTLLFWALLLVLALAPLLLGSARPLVWSLWAVYLGLLGFIYFAMLAALGERLRIRPTKLPLTSLAFVVTCAYLVVQVLPVLPTPILAAGGIEITAPQISIAPGMTLLMLVRQLAFGLFALLVMQIAVNDKRRSRFLQAMLLIAIIYGVYGLAALQMGDTILGMAKWAYEGSATGPFVNRNSFATFLGFGAILALAHAAAVLVRQSERHPHDGRIGNYLSTLFLYGVAYAFLLVVVVATQSRMGLFATLAGSSVVILITVLSIGKLRFAILALPVGLAMLAGAVYLIGGGLLERIETVEFSTMIRTNLYEQVIDLIRLRPWTGFGGGSFELAFPLVHELPVSPDYAWNRAHNTYLTLWSELGLVVGSLPIIAVALLGLRMAWALVRREGSWTAQTAGLGVIVLAGVHSLVDFSLEIQANTLCFLAIVAIGAATTIIPEEER